MENVKKNFIYNIIYQVLILIIPLITAPYLSRVVGAEGVGTYSYTYSIVYYFMLFTLLGVNNYGNRTIAKVRDDKKQLSKTFCEIYFFQFLLGILMMFIYILYICCFAKDYKVIASIQIIFIISSILDINWLFYGLEEFKKTITRNSIVKIGTVILIFIFVKNTNDLWKYTLIMSLTTLIGQIIMWSFAIKIIKFRKIKISDLKKHIKPNLLLFIPVIAVSLYKMMDKVMLGFLTSVSEVGFYENAEKIVNIPLTFITALGTVMLPRISNMISKGDKEKVLEYIDKSIKFVLFLSSAMCFGLIAISRKFAPLYFGWEFEKTGILIVFLATTLPFVSVANVLRTQYLIPQEKDKIYIVSVFAGAIINFLINLILIPKFTSEGACIGTIVAEATVMIYQLFSLKKELPILLYLKNSLIFIIKGLIMLIVLQLINNLIINEFLKIIIQIVIGVIVYFLLNLKYIFSILDFKKILNKVYIKA